MSYFPSSKAPSAGLGQFGCGSECKCRSCSSRPSNLSEVYEKDDDLNGFAPYASYGSSVEVAEPEGRICRAAERRIRPIIEPPDALLVHVPTRLTAGGKRGVRLHHACFAAYSRLKLAAEGDGIPPGILTIVSGYRSVAHQTRLWEMALAKYGSPADARIWVAPPGGSAHHTGRAIDFNLGGSVNKRNIPALRRTAAYRWMVCNAHRFGFTPYAAEPWHWEFNPPGFDPSVPPIQRYV